MVTGAEAARLGGAAKVAYIFGMFSHIAARYDLLNKLFTFGRVRHWRRAAARLAQLPQNGLALDLCTGTAELALELAQETDSILAIDFCPPMMVRGRTKTAKKGLEGRVSFLMADALALPLNDDCVDGVTVGFALRNVADLKQLFTEMRRVLKPGGRAVCVEMTRPAPGWRQLPMRLYLNRVVPLLGRLLSGDGEAYSYLAHSINGFPEPEEVKQIMEAAGLRQVRYLRFNLGTVAIHVGVK